MHLQRSPTQAYCTRSFMAMLRIVIFYYVGSGDRTNSFPLMARTAHLDQQIYTELIDTLTPLMSDQNQRRALISLLFENRV